MIEKIDDYNLLGEKVYHAIKDAINKNELKPGEKVTETKLAKALGVSRTPVREALRILNSQGYVILTPNSSFVVNSFTQKDAQEILQVRGALEGEAARIAAKMITEEQIQEMRQIFSQIHSLNMTVNNEVEAFEFYSADVAFHQYIMKIAGNSHMIQISNSLGDRMYRMRVAISQMPGSVNICQGHHEAIMNAIISHDGELAYLLSRNHTAYISNVVVPLIEDNQKQ